MGYAEKIAKKNSVPYISVKRIYLDDTSTYIESSGEGKWQIVSPHSVFKIKEDGGIYISGNVKIDSPLEIDGDLTCKKKVIANSIEDKSKV